MAKGRGGLPGSVQPKADSNWPAQASVARVRRAPGWPPPVNGEPAWQNLEGGGSPYRRRDGEARRNYGTAMISRQTVVASGGPTTR
jgi:hypothetical protein